MSRCQKPLSSVSPRQKHRFFCFQESLFPLLRTDVFHLNVFLVASLNTIHLFKDQNNASKPTCTVRQHESVSQQCFLRNILGKNTLKAIHSANDKNNRTWAAFYSDCQKTMKSYCQTNYIPWDIFIKHQNLSDSCKYKKKT